MKSFRTAVILLSVLTLSSAAFAGDRPKESVQQKSQAAAAQTAPAAAPAPAAPVQAKPEVRPQPATAQPAAPQPAVPVKPAAKKPLTEIEKLDKTESEFRALAADKRKAAEAETDKAHKESLESVAKNFDKMADKIKDQRADELIYDKDPAVKAARAKRDQAAAELKKAQAGIDAARAALAQKTDNAFEEKKKAQAFAYAMRTLDAKSSASMNADTEANKAEQNAKANAAPKAPAKGS